MNRQAIVAWLSVLLFAGILGASGAQPGPMMDPERQERLKQRVEMMRIWKLTELLNLDEQRATVFFPRYRTYLTTMDSLDAQLRRVDEAIEGGLRGESADFDKLRNLSLELEKKRFERGRELITSSGDILNEQEQAALMLFERRFHQRLREMVHEIQREEGPPYRRGRGHSPGTGSGP